MIESEKERGNGRGKKNGSEKEKRERGKENGNGSVRENENERGSEKGQEKEKRSENGKENGKTKTGDAMTAGRSARTSGRIGASEKATRREKPRNVTETKGVPAPGSPPSAGGSILPTVTPTTVGMTKMKNIDS